MKRVTAAQLLLDDPIVVSPELALVDADLSAHLRATLPERSEPITLEVESAPELGEDGDLADEPESVSNESADPAEITSVVVAVDDLPDYVIAPAVGTPEAGDMALEGEESPSTPDPLPDYVVAPADDTEQSNARLDTEVYSADDVAGFSVSEGERAPASETVQARVADYGSATEEASDALMATPTASFPNLPSLDVRQEALDETDAALRRIRDQLGGNDAPKRPRVRRRFIVLSGLFAMAAVGAFAAESHAQVVQLTGWLGL